MSSLIAIPELMESAAQDLAGLGSTLDQARAAASTPTTGIIAAAEDEVSAAVASAFGSFGKEYQALSAQAAAFHDAFVNLLNGGADAYLGTEIANAEQNLLGAVNAPAQTLLGRSLIPTGGPSLLASGPGGLASVTGPYQTLFANTSANLQLLGNAFAANPAPFLHQILANQIGYGRTIVAGLQNFVANFPGSLQTAIQEFEQALQNFNAQALLQTLANDLQGYWQTITTAFGSAAHDFSVGLQALPAAFQAAFQDLIAGNFSGAASQIGGGIAGLFVTGVDVQLQGLNTFLITPTGTIGDLLPLFTIPGQVGQNVADLFPAGSIPQQIALNFSHAANTALNTTISSTVVITTKLFPPSVNLSVNNFFGTPWSLLLDSVGAPVATLDAITSSTSAFTGAVQAGNAVGAIDALVDAPAVIANGFLNGHVTEALTLNISGIPLTIDLPFNGILAPASTYTASVNLGPPFPVITVPVTGTPISGIVPALVNWLPEQLAESIGKTA
jgi:PE family